MKTGDKLARERLLQVFPKEPEILGEFRYEQILVLAALQPILRGAVNAKIEF